MVCVGGGNREARCKEWDEKYEMSDVRILPRNFQRADYYIRELQILIKQSIILNVLINVVFCVPQIRNPLPLLLNSLSTVQYRPLRTYPSIVILKIGCDV